MASLARTFTSLPILRLLALVAVVAVVGIGTGSGVHAQPAVSIQAERGLAIHGNGAFSTSLAPGTPIRQLKVQGETLRMTVQSPTHGTITVVAKISAVAPPPAPPPPAPPPPPFIRAAWNGTITTGGGPGSGLEPGMTIFGSVGTPGSPDQIVVSTGGPPPPNNLTAQFPIGSIRIR